MGVKDFSKIINGSSFDPKTLKNKSVAIDAMIQLHRTGRPFKTSNASQIAVLTGNDGKNTNHINGLISVITSLHSYGAQQIWVFDNVAEPNALKSLELEKRHNSKLNAQKKLDEISNELFSDSDSEIEEDVYLLKEKYVRASYNIEPYMIEDLQYILLELGIKMITAPAGIEAEALCAYLTRINTTHPDYCNYVLSRDFDCFLFGAPAMLITMDKKWEIYTLQNILESQEINYYDLVKIGVILGCDFAPKTPKIGPKSVIQKFRNVSLTEAQQKAYDYFVNTTASHIDYILTHKPKTSDSVQNLLLWLIEVKGFSASRIQSRLTKSKII